MVNPNERSRPITLVALGSVVIRGLAALPPQLGIRIGAILGWCLYWVAASRRQVCARNIGVCFSELTPVEQQRRVRQCFVEHGIGLVETAWAWHRPVNFIADRLDITGQDLIETAMQDGRGVLLLCPHYSMLDLVAPIVFHSVGRFVISYRPNDNVEFDREVVRGRSRFGDLVHVRSIRDIVKRLKAGELVWFGPDQDMGLRGVVFAPFFGRPASTVTTPARLARMSGATTLFLDVHRTRDRYVVQFRAMPEDYPSQDELVNASALNQMIEAALSDQPAQYMWMHKRFKTNPDGSRQTLYQSH
jgi:KDO2-lipid IV(A) lauroyltransferase